MSQPDTGKHLSASGNTPSQDKGIRIGPTKRGLFLKGYQNSHDKEAGWTICRSGRKAWCCRGVHARPWNGRGGRNSLLVSDRVAAVDSNRHIVSVKASAGPPVVPEEGSTIIGVVEKVQEKMAIVNIIVVDGHKLQPPFTGMLHISN